MDYFKSPYDRDFKNFYDTEIKNILEQQDWFKTTMPGVQAPATPAVTPAGQPPEDITKTIQEPPKIPALPRIPPMPASPQLEKQVDTESGEVTYIDPKTRLEIPVENVPAPKPPVFDPTARVTNAPPPAVRIAPPLPKLRIGAQHAQFYQSLETMAEESPSVLASHIIRYARSILNSDLETSIKLLKIASNIKGK
jgi:hypothetical protein